MEYPDGWKLPETDEEVRDIFDAWDNHVVGGSAWAIHTIFRVQHPEEAVLDTFMRTLTHVIDTQERALESRVKQRTDEPIY